MSNGQKKDILVGMHVAVLLEDGIYAPATVERLQFQRSVPENNVYAVRFNDNSISECLAKNMIGTNFKPLSDFCNQPFQKVYTTHNGKEVSGFIQRCQGDQILISIPGASEEKEIISKKLNEIRMFDSRYAQRFQLNNSSTVLNTDNDDFSTGRAVSDSIEVPYQTRRFRRTSEEPTMNELMAAMVLSSLSCSPVFHHPKGSPRSYDSSGIESWTHDSKHTSPSRHSSSRNTPAHTPAVDGELKEKEQSDGNRSQTPEDVLDPGSEMILLQRSTPTPTKQQTPKSAKMEEDSDEPQDLSLPKVHIEETTSPRPRSRSSHLSSSYSDVGKLDVVMEQEEQQKSEPKVAITMAMPIAIQPRIPMSYYVSPNFFQPPFFASLPAEFRVQLPTTSNPRVTEVGSSAPGHIDSKMHRYSHRTAPYQKVNEDSTAGSPAAGNSPSTFGSPPASYFHLPTTPIPVSSLSFSPSHHRKQTRSPLATKSQTFHHPTSAHITHSTPVSVPSNSAAVAYPILQNLTFNTSMPEPAIANMKPASWHAGAAQTHQFMSKPVIQPRQPTQQQRTTKKTAFPSPKAPPIPFGRKVRGDGKKCRKVYGMDHRDMWCTACRWKKACQRFPD